MQKTESIIAFAIQALFFLALIAAWFLVTSRGLANSLLLPPPYRVWTSMVEMVQTQSFWGAVKTTLVTVAKAYVIAIVMGLFVAYSVTRSQTVHEVVEPILAGIFTIPLTLFFPLFVMFFGIGTASKVAYAAVYGFFPIALNGIAAFANVDKRFLNAARSMGATPQQLLRRVLLPGTLPVVITGLRIGFFITFASVLGGETIMAISGIGRSIALSAELMETAQMFAWILLVILSKVFLNAMLTSVENKRYRHHGG